MANAKLIDALRNRFEAMIADDPEAVIAFLLDGENAVMQNNRRDSSADDRTDDRLLDRRNRQTLDVDDQPARRGRPAVSGRGQAEVRQRTARSTRQRYATVAYSVRRNRVGKIVAEPKRPADQVAFKFLARHKNPVTILELEQATKLSNSVLRNNLYRMQREGVIDTHKIDAE